MTDGSYQYKVCVGVTQKIHVVPEQIFWSGHTKPTIEPWDALDFAQQQLLIVKFGPNAANANWKRPQTTRKKKRKSISRRKLLQQTPRVSDRENNMNLQCRIHSIKKKSSNTNEASTMTGKKHGKETKARGRVPGTAFSAAHQRLYCRLS